MYASSVRDLHVFELSSHVRYLTEFIERNSCIDGEFDDLYSNVFLKYMTYCRLNFHK